MDQTADQLNGLNSRHHTMLLLCLHTNQQNRVRTLAAAETLALVDNNNNNTTAAFAANAVTVTTNGNSKTDAIIKSEI